MPSGKARYNAPKTFVEIVQSGSAPSLSNFSRKLKNELARLYVSSINESQLCKPVDDEDEKTRFQRSFHLSNPEVETNSDQVNTDTAIRFTNEILSAASSAFGDLEHLRLGIAIDDLRVERRNLITKLRAAANKIEKYPIKSRQDGFVRLTHALRRISPDLLRCLPMDADPRACADALEAFTAGIIARENCVANIRNFLILVDDESVTQAVENAGRKLEEKEIRYWVAVDLAVRVLPILSMHGLSVTAYHSSPAVWLLKMIGENLGIKLTHDIWREVVSEAKRGKKRLSKRKK